MKRPITLTSAVEGVYLRHFTKPLGRAKHYIGWSPDIDKRVFRHKAVKGAKFTASAVRNGAELLLVRVWPGGDRRLEWVLKKSGAHRVLCPLCKAHLERAE
jgi:hypothetical protein